MVVEAYRKRQSYYMIQGLGMLMCFVAYSETELIQNEFHLHQFASHDEACSFKDQLDDFWWIAG